MATADEILESMDVQGEEGIILIDNDMRKIVMPDELQMLGVESDKEVRRLRFRMPETYGEFNLAEFDLRINYLNAAGRGDVYIVKDKEVKDGAIEFSWLVGSFATMYKGRVQFIVCAKKMNEGTIEKEFNTTRAELPVLEGLEVEQGLIEQDPGIIEQILYRLGKVEEKEDDGGSVDLDITLTQSGMAADAKATGDAIEAERVAREEAIRQIGSSFAYLGLNPITSTDEDTPAKWTELGIGMARFTTSLLNGQPGAYGALLNWAEGGAVWQEFNVSPNGPTYNRSGNTSSGWSATGWRRIYDTSNKPPYPVTSVAGKTGAVLLEPLTINGQSYDGSEAVSVAVEGGSTDYTLPIAAPDTLGGVKAAAKTDGMTQEIGVDADGKLWGMPGGSSSEKSVGFKYVDTFDLSSGAVRYDMDVDDANEFLLVVTETATCSGGTVELNGVENASIKSFQLKTYGKSFLATKLGEDGARIQSPRSDSDGLTNTIIAKGESSIFSGVYLSYTSASAGKVALYKR